MAEVGALPRPLTASELARFEADGYLVVKGVLTEADFAPFEKDYGTLIEVKAQSMFQRQLIPRLHAAEPFERRLACIAADCDDTVIKNEIDPFGLQLDLMHARQRGAFELFFARRLLDVVSSIVGPEVELNPIQHARPLLPFRGGKQTKSGAATLAPWHQDQGVTLEEADASEILTCWIPLVDVSLAAGDPRPLQVMPKVHRRKAILRHIKSDLGTTIDPHEIDPQWPVVDVEMQRGDVLLMNRFTPHRTQPNNSEKVRWSIDLRFQKTGTPTGRPFWPSFVLRSPSNAHSVSDSHEQWCARWVHCLANSQGQRWHRVAGDVGGSTAAVVEPDPRSRL